MLKLHEQTVKSLQAMSTDELTSIISTCDTIPDHDTWIYLYLNHSELLEKHFPFETLYVFKGLRGFDNPTLGKESDRIRSIEDIYHKQFGSDVKGCKEIIKSINLPNGRIKYPNLTVKYFIIQMVKANKKAASVQSSLTVDDVKVYYVRHLTIAAWREIDEFFDGKRFPALEDDKLKAIRLKIEKYNKDISEILGDEYSIDVDLCANNCRYFINNYVKTTYNVDIYSKV